MFQEGASVWIQPVVLTQEMSLTLPSVCSAWPRPRLGVLKGCQEARVENTAVFCAHFSALWCVALTFPWFLPSLIFWLLGLHCSSTSSFSISFSSLPLLPLKMLPLSSVFPWVLFSSHLYSPEMQASRTAVPLREEGGEEPQPADWTLAPLSACCGTRWSRRPLSANWASAAWEGTASWAPWGFREKIAALNMYSWSHVLISPSAETVSSFPLVIIKSESSASFWTPESRAETSDCRSLKRKCISAHF